MAVGGMQAVAGYQQQKRQADQQNALYRANATNALAAFQQKQVDTDRRIQQERMQAAENNFNSELAARKAEATNVVAAGESGAVGQSTDALMHDIQGQESRQVDNTNTNLDWTVQQLQGQKQGFAYEALDRINSVKKADTPSFAGAMLQIAGAGVKALTPATRGSSISSLGE
jgi:hypothetical protein